MVLGIVTVVFRVVPYHALRRLSSHALSRRNRRLLFCDWALLPLPNTMGLLTVDAARGPLSCHEALVSAVTAFSFGGTQRIELCGLHSSQPSAIRTRPSLVALSFVLALSVARAR